MPLRPREHILETESRRAFERVMPAEWVVRPQESDYGLDAQVQIFRGGRASTSFFYVQLKATDSIDSSEANPTYRFKTERLLHYVEYPFPVMLVLYDANERRLFYEWVHPIYHNLSEEERRKWHSQETATISFTHRLDGTDMAVIDRDVRHQSVQLGHQPDSNDIFTIDLSINFSSELEANVRRRLEQWLQGEQASSFIRITNQGTPDGQIEVQRDPDVAILTCGEERVLLPLGSSLGEQLSEDELLIAAQLAVASILSIAGRSQSSIDLISRFIFEESELTGVALFMLTHPSIAAFYAQANRTAEALDIAEEMLRRGYTNLAMIFASTVRISSVKHSFYSQQFRRYMKTAIATAPEIPGKAAMHYNLANSLRADSYHKEAISHYHKAALINPAYRERPYWWGELAGCMFLLNKYIWAEQCYRKAIELGETNLPVKYLLGDVLLHRGEFERARQTFAEYFEEAEPPVADAILKDWLATTIFNQFGNTHRNPSLAESLIVRALETDDPNGEE